MGLLDKTTKTERRQSTNSLPSYNQAIGQPPAVPPLNLAQNAGPAEFTTVTHYECIAHLKFLAALSDLRDTVTSTSNLFDIRDPSPREFESQINEAWALAKEKRWAVYTARAVERYTEWWNACVPASRPRPTTDDLSSDVIDDVTVCSTPITWTTDELPPLDVLMVWHAHMLNPRAFLEDCIRHGKMSFWSTGFPWETINPCIDNQTLVYDAGKPAATEFSRKTAHHWDNLRDMPCKILACPRCGLGNDAPWAKGEIALPLDETFDRWSGFADKNFGVYCARCKLRITHDALRVHKFRTDLKSLMDNNIPMPGTVLSLFGIPARQSLTRRRHQQADFPNRFLRAVTRDLLEYIKSNMGICPSVTMLRDYLAGKLQDKDIMREANPSTFGISLHADEKVAFRRMMSRYWDNSSQFALDLVGAVVRQGRFIEKMDNFDWLHSPALTDTTLRLVRKYAVFFQIMAANPGQMAVPTLDVDLAWHTHQLTPSRYFEYSITRTEKEGRRAIFIDHDDKVGEVKLSNGFEWTSKMFRKLTDGGVYSECTCWYCEATRASDLDSNAISRIRLPMSSAAKARSAANNLHDNPDVSSNGPHISAHNSIKLKPKFATVSGNDPGMVKYLKLRSEFERTLRRADKRRLSRSPPKYGSDTKEEDKDEHTAYPLVWGCPVAVPYSAPYGSDPGVHSDAYAADPSCFSLQGACATMPTPEHTGRSSVEAGGCRNCANGCANAGFSRHGFPQGAFLSAGCAGGGACGSGGGCGGTSGGGGGGGCGGGGGGC